VPRPGPGAAEEDNGSDVENTGGTDGDGEAAKEGEEESEELSEVVGTASAPSSPMASEESGPDGGAPQYESDEDSARHLQVRMVLRIWHAARKTDCAHRDCFWEKVCTPFRKTAPQAHWFFSSAPRPRRHIPTRRIARRVARRRRRATKLSPVARRRRRLWSAARTWRRRGRQGLTLVHFSAQLKRVLSDRDAFRDCLGGVQEVSRGINEY